MSRQFLVAAAVLGSALITAGCQFVNDLTHPKPPDWQDVGVIQMKGRVVPSEIVLVKGRPARLHVTAGMPGDGCTVQMDTLELTRPVKQGEVTTVELTREQVDKLNGRRLRCGPGGGEAAFRIINKGEPAPATGSEVAVVMTHELAAPKEVTLVKGVPVKLYVTKTASEEGFDKFTCDQLGIRMDVTDGEVSTVELTPLQAGTYTFVGTVTPDSRVSIVVIDQPVP